MVYVIITTVFVVFSFGVFGVAQCTDGANLRATKPVTTVLRKAE